jgi:hypothetical protein
MNKKLIAVDFNGNSFDTNEIWLEHHAQAIFNYPIECLEWFVDGDTHQLYTIIEEGITLDDWMKSMSNRIVFYNTRYFILEEEEIINFMYISKPDELGDFIERQESIWQDLETVESELLSGNETLVDWLQEELMTVVRLYKQTKGE